jgi:NAD-dependent dihydropyrimidine dehydrogenase PreA subunit
MFLAMAYVITSACIEEKAADCAEVCPVDCIKDGGDQFYIDPDVCIDCGACEVSCPVSAIYYIDDVPEEEQEFIQKAIDFFKK